LENSGHVKEVALSRLKNRVTDSRKGITGPADTPC